MKAVISEMESLRQGLNQDFPCGPKTAGIDWQKVAAFAAARRRFCVIAGGPGTGKTTTVAKILALLVEQSKEQRLRTALVSPTGKGAARLQEAMKKVKENLTCEEKCEGAHTGQSLNDSSSSRACHGFSLFSF